MFLLDERILADGTHARTHARLAGDKLELIDTDGTHGELSVAAVDKVMTRYGRDLADDIALDGDTLALSAGYRLRRLRYHAVVDAEGRDYLVWERPDQVPLAVVATMATAALRYLVTRLADERTKGSSSSGPSEI